MSPLTLPDNDSAPFFILGKDKKGVSGAQLAGGDTIAVSSSDPATVIVDVDASPSPAPDGTPSVASGVVRSPATVGNPNQPITINAQVTKADGTPGDAISDTVTVVPDAEATLGVLFGEATPIPAPVPAPTT